MAELSGALAAGMTPAISYWSSDDLLWMDGIRADHRDGCSKQTACSKMVKLDSFAIEYMSSRPSELVQMQQSGALALHGSLQGQSRPHADHPMPDMRRLPDTRRPSPCSRAWEQCGGLRWEGPRCCEFGSICQLVNSTRSVCKVLFRQTNDGLLEQSYSRNRIDGSSKSGVTSAAATDDVMSFVKVALFAGALGLGAIVVAFRTGVFARSEPYSHRASTLRVISHSQRRTSWRHSLMTSYTPIVRL